MYEHNRQRTARDMLGIVALAALVALTAMPTSAASVADDDYRILVLTFPDLAGDGPLAPDCLGCDGQFATGDAIRGRLDPLPEVEVVIRDRSGAELERKTTQQLPNGRQAATFNVPAAGRYEIEVIEIPDGWQLCADTDPEMTVSASDFESDTDTARVTFGFWQKCADETRATDVPTAEAVTELPAADAAEEATAAPTPAPTEAPPTAEARAAIPTAPTAKPEVEATPTPAPGPWGGIKGLVYVDLDGDGRLAPDEPGLMGIIVNLSGWGLALRQETTSAGNFHFGGLRAGSYDATIGVPPGYRLTTPERYSGILVDGDIVSGVDFGLARVDVGAPTAPAPTGPALPSAGITIQPSGRLLLGLAGLIGVLGLLGMAVESGRSRRS